MLLSFASSLSSTTYSIQDIHSMAGKFFYIQTIRHSKETRSSVNSCTVNWVATRVCILTTNWTHKRHPYEHTTISRKNTKPYHICPDTKFSSCGMHLTLPMFPWGHSGIDARITTAITHYCGTAEIIPKTVFEYKVLLLLYPIGNVSQIQIWRPSNANLVWSWKRDHHLKIHISHVCHLCRNVYISCVDFTKRLSKLNQAPELPIKKYTVQLTEGTPIAQR